MDPILLFGSLAAILVMAFVAARMFPVKNLLDDGRVRRNITRYEPDAVVTDIYIANDGKAALAKLEAPADSVGLAVQLGDRVVCRILHAADITRVEKRDAKLVIHFDDFTQPSVSLLFDETTLPKAHELVSALTGVSTDKEIPDAA
jgi:hypothetical protein